MTKDVALRCIVKGCTNHTHQGLFVGSLCSPCNTFITTGVGRYSQAYRNTRRPWVSLTEEQKDSLLLPFGSYWVIEAIEAILKEKNGV